jgi:L,D-transpeptidase ErfK/SrfK
VSQAERQARALVVTRRWVNRRLLLTAVSTLAGGWVARAEQPLECSTVAGAIFAYAVAPRDTWRSLGARHGIAPTALAALNGRRVADTARVGETITIDSRHLVPLAIDSGIVINVPQRMLYLRRDVLTLAAYPVGVGSSGWPTFVGPFTVAVREKDPVWDVPPSIQEELRRAGKPVVTRVPPGPANPLGRYWLGLSAPNFGIHGTNAPLSIYRFESHGCIRMHPDDIVALWTGVAVHTAGVSIYEPVLIAAVGDDILLEAHPDVYRRHEDGETVRRSVLATTAGMGTIDPATVEQVLTDRDGRPHIIGKVAR